MHLEEYEIKYLCLTAREIFINQPILLELEAPIKICGAYCANQVTSTDSTMTCFGSSNMVASLRRPIICSSVTMSTVASRV